MASAKSKPVATGEAVPPPDSADRREFLKEQEAMRRREAAAAAARRAAVKARERATGEQKLEDIKTEDTQAEKDRKSREAYERFQPQPMRRGGAVKKYAKGGSVSSASKRADGCATKGKTRGKFV
jgi:hypothetical protein